MNAQKVIRHINDWLKDYLQKTACEGFVIGVSGGIDSAVTSTLCALTGRSVFCLEMDIHQNPSESSRAMQHIHWLEHQFSNVSHYELNLTSSFETLRGALPEETQQHGRAMANTRSRLRMTVLYAVAQSRKLLVAGTGNKVEDFGVGFYTKYGDGGVDLSPIADLTKSEVYAVAEALKVGRALREATPTDGLWGDGRTDEHQLGATYPELEWAMAFEGDDTSKLTARQREVLAIYRSFHRANRHKMQPIPVCHIPNELKMAE